MITKRISPRINQVGDIFKAKKRLKLAWVLGAVYHLVAASKSINKRGSQAVSVERVSNVFTSASTSTGWFRSAGASAKARSGSKRVPYFFLRRAALAPAELNPAL